MGRAETAAHSGAECRRRARCEPRTTRTDAPIRSIPGLGRLRQRRRRLGRAVGPGNATRAPLQTAGKKDLTLRAQHGRPPGAWVGKGLPTYGADPDVPCVVTP
jgi:hypothetical protein